MSKFYLRSWSSDQTKRLKEMWWDGHSAAFIAGTLGIATARAVADKAHYSGFVRNPAIALAAKAHKVAQHLVPMVRDDGSLVTMVNVRTRECRYMFGDEPSIDAPMCGRPIKEHSLCADHLARCYTSKVPWC